MADERTENASQAFRCSSAADGASVYVANWFDNSLSRIDVASLRVVGEARTGDGPRAFGQFIARVPAQ